MSAANPRRNPWLALIGVAIASFLGCIDFTIVNTALPALGQELGIALTRSQWLITAFVMALAAFMVTAGRLADLFGRRRMMLGAMLLFGIASLAAGLSASLAALVLWRVVQGLACAVLYTASTAIVGHALFDARQRGKAIGLLYSANGLGLAIGPVAGGLIVAAWGWRWVFLLNVPLILIGLALVWRHVEESAAADDGQGLDLAGLLLLTLTLPFWVLVLVRGGSWGWSSPTTLGLLAWAALLLVILIVVERRVAAPLLRFDFLARPAFSGACLATAGLAFFYCAAFLLMPLYLADVRGLSSAAVGLLLLPTTAVLALLSPWAGRWADRFGTRPVLLAGFALLVASALLQSGFDGHSPWWWVILAFILMGAGWACILGPSTLAAIAAVPGDASGVAMGMSWTLHNLAGALGLAVSTLVLQHVSGDFVAGYQQVMTVLASVSALVLPSLLVLLRKGPVGCAQATA
ncbi:MFS transporter [Pseudomonas sp. MWU16-30317]|uniref:MFS transporter n=1 Tax=Pseudomonas sp. MWU16-30317 TaxID=2878095 RepID=UPI001CF97AC3|nr:MFS transporter [Pseudomonas sp. MWU16-30317]